MKLSGKRNAGLSLAELLIALALLSLITLTIANVLIKGNVYSSSVNMRMIGANEIQMLISDIQEDLHQGASISNNSYNQRLEYTTYSNTGVATKKIYRITTISGNKYLQLSTDGGTTWVSPYRVSDYDNYILKNTPKFLYAWAINNCTDFVDSSGNGIWLSGTDTAGAYLACTNGTSSPALTLPSQATKVDFQSFLFSTGKGSPEATRSLPTDLFVSVATPLVRSNTSMTSPAVKDAPLVQAFATNTDNSLFGDEFTVRSAAWDPGREQLCIVGDSSLSTGNHPNNKTVFVADRKGVVQNKGLASTSTSSLDSVAVRTSGTDILALDSTAKIIYGINTIGTSSWSASSILNLGSPTNLINTPTGIAFDADTPTDFYIVGADPGTGAMKIYQRNISSGALVGSAWSLPAAFDGTHPPGGLAIEPVNGDFIVARNYVNGSSPNKTIDIYIISRAAGTSTSFSVNIDDLGSNATGTTGKWGVGYDAANNRLFLSDSAAFKIYEVIPSQLITPRS